MTPAPDWFRALPTDRLMLELSLWSADLARLADDLARTASAADLYHVDVADGHFAPALLFFPDLVAAVRKRTAVPLHVHLMAADPVLPAQIDQFADAGADLISVHAENGAVDEQLDHIARRGVAAGVVLQLHTPVPAAAPWLDRVRFVTLLGTAIGVKGQGLAPEAEARLREARALASGAGHRVVVAADGGIREHTVPALRAAGADTVVMGSLAFAAPDLGARVAWARGLGARA
ncbi:D-allulose-6-phosphate 3-epimerase [Gemmatimonadetes bacterium T265]|nr:D-allulose-6-phosphate 3-epimerase [Gemmatimonadetes bacterium T265]